MDHVRYIDGRHKMASIPPAHLLMQARAGKPYFNQSQHELELAAVAVHLLRTRERAGCVKTYRRLRTQLENDSAMPCDLDRERAAYALWAQGPPGDSAVGRLLTRHGLGRGDVEAWVNSFEADSMAEALAAMAGRRWPAFLLVFTLNRVCKTAEEACAAIRVYEQELGGADPQFQTELTYLAIRIAQRHVLEMVPAVSRIYAAGAHSSAQTPADYNELLWQIARFGTAWKPQQRHILAAAQQVLVEALGKTALDRKGYAAIAYTILHTLPETARALVDAGEAKPAAGVPATAYKHGRAAIYILTSTTTEEALETMHRQPAADRPAFLWSMLLLGLSGRQLLTEDLALRIWRFLEVSEQRLDTVLVGRVLHGLREHAHKKRVLEAAARRGVPVTARLAASLALTHRAGELEQAYAAGGARSDPPVLRAVLETQAFLDPGAAWATYQRLLEQTEPDAETLAVLCRAAGDPQLRWGSLYAAQRAVREVRMRVRGLRGASDDVTRVYPDQTLVHNYIVLLGRARYHDELREVLPWLEKVGLRAERRALCALILHSPEGPALLRMGERSGDPAWPSAADFEAYKYYLGV